MTCNNCGITLPDNAQKCHQCNVSTTAYNNRHNADSNQAYANMPVGPNQINQNYNQPISQNYSNYIPHQAQNQNTVKTSTYLLWRIISLIPLVGIIASIVFALDSSNKNRSNFFKSGLILSLIKIIFGIAVAILLFFGSIAIFSSNSPEVFEALEHYISFI